MMRLGAAAMLALLGACAAGPGPQAVAGRNGQPVIAITVDDIPEHGALPAGVTRADVARGMVDALKTAGIPAIGFINGARTDNEDALEALEIWAAGFPVGNHGWSHRSLNQVTVSDYREEIARNEPLLARLAGRREWRWYRYPFLHEGDDPEKRRAIRLFLAERGYRIAAVTMDFSDWAYNEPYVRCVAKGDQAAIAALEEEWLAAARHRAIASREMAQALFGRDVPYVLLTHLGALDARLFPRLIEMYRNMGFGFVTLEEAQSDPVYAEDNDPARPPRSWTLEERIREKGLALPAPRTPAVDLDSICT